MVHELMLMKIFPAFFPKIKKKAKIYIGVSVLVLKFLKFH